MRAALTVVIVTAWLLGVDCHVSAQAPRLADARSGQARGRCAWTRGGGDIRPDADRLRRERGVGHDTVVQPAPPLAIERRQYRRRSGGWGWWSGCLRGNAFSTPEPAHQVVGGPYAGLTKG